MIDYFERKARKVLWIVVMVLLIVPHAIAKSSDPQTKNDSISIGVKTNLLYDVLAIPNLEGEIYWANRYSIAAGWEYAWWKSDKRHRYWRINGGSITFRRWFGKRVAERPLSGHHIGIYGQLSTYDFEWGKKGRMSDKWNYGGGIEYGFSLPVARCLHLDFSMGLGYRGGKYKEYLPIDGHYVWQADKRKHYWGITRAEVSLVWITGWRSRTKKGGGR